MDKEGLPQRKRMRLKDFDYASPGVYFVTICTYEKLCTLGYVDPAVGQGLCPCRLSQTGTLVQDEIERISDRFPTASVKKYVVMPNHVHLLLTLNLQADIGQESYPCPQQQLARRSIAFGRQGQSPCPTFPALGTVIGAFKSITTKRVNSSLGTPGKKLWQTRFHEHIVRGDKDYETIWHYIEDNPIRWSEDVYFAQTER